MSEDAQGCDNCGQRCRKRFCSDRCRAQWHREHDPSGTVRSVRRLAGGGTAVIVHFTDHDAERALHFELRAAVVLGALQGTEGVKANGTTSTGS